MGKMISVLLVLGCIFLFSASQCEAGPFAKGRTGTAADEAAAAQAAIERARQTLQAKEWVVYLTPEGGRGSGETDVITFTQEGKVSSRNLLAKGYGDSNYRLVVDGAGTPIWETMKVDKEKNLAFLRGELRGGVMTGSIFLKSTRGATETYYYSSAQSAAAPAAVATETTTTTTTRRRGR